MSFDRKNTVRRGTGRLKLVPTQPQAPDHLQELKNRIGAADLLLQATADQLRMAKAALAALEGGKA